MGKKSKEMRTHVLCQTKLSRLKCLESLLNWVNVKTSIFRYLAFLYYYYVAPFVT